MKKIYLAVLLALCLAAMGLCAAFAEDAAPVTAEELAAWAGELKARALESAPENDPTDESADVEGGIMFLYPFATLYADRTEMTAETVLSAVALSETEDATFRDAALSMTPGELTALFPCNTPDQAGTREGAVLYLQETDAGALRYGRIRRDGQRVFSVDYGDLEPAGDGWYMAQVTFEFSEGLLSGISAQGFNPETAPRLTEAEKNELAAELNALAGETGYRAVKSSRNGAELAPFGPEDLVFSGLDFLSLRPEDLPGTPESETIDNGDGTSLLRVDGDGYVAVFFTGADGNSRVVSLSIEDDEMEGPRCVRLGDAFHEDMQRFRFENRGPDGQAEVLYGADNEVPRGRAEYGADSLALRYITEVPGGGEAELLLNYSLSKLSEIILYIR